MDYKKMKINDIILWCQQNKQTAWLKDMAKKTEMVEEYPKKIVIDENGREKAVADKSKKAKLVEKPISFLTLKKAFCEKFMPEIIPQKKAKTTWHDTVAGLK